MSCEKNIQLSIQMDTCIHLIVKNINDDSFLIEVSQQATILGVKKVIEEVIGIHPKDQKLIFRGKILPDSLLIMKLKLKDMASIYLSTKCVKKDSEDLSDLFFSAIRRSSTDKFINTLVEKIKNKHPKYSHALKDPDVIREEFEILQNPQLHAEFMKSADRMMNAIEMRAGSYQKLINFHELFNEMYSEISLDFQTKDEYPTVIPKEKATSPSTEPLQLHYPFPHDFFQILQQTDESPEGKALTQLVKAVLTCFWPTKKKESKPSPFFMQSDDESENEGKETNEDLYQNYEMFSSDEEEEEDSSKQEENEISKTDSDNSDIDLESYLFEPD